MEKGCCNNIGNYVTISITYRQGIASIAVLVYRSHVGETPSLCQGLACPAEPEIGYSIG